MYCGSIAIALSAEYGEVSLGSISLIGSSCRRRRPAVSSQRAMAPMSPISPMPQLRDEGMEKSGTSRPARRDGDLAGGGSAGDITEVPSGVQGGCRGKPFVPSAIHEPEQARGRVVK